MRTAGVLAGCPAGVSPAAPVGEPEVAVGAHLEPLAAVLEVEAEAVAEGGGRGEIGEVVDFDLERDRLRGVVPRQPRRGDVERGLVDVGGVDGVGDGGVAFLSTSCGWLPPQAGFWSSGV